MSNKGASLDTESLRRIFDKFDADQSGTVSSDELRKLTEMLGMDLTGEEMQAMMKDADHDGSGQISFAEFEVALQKTGSKKSVGAMLGTLRAVFNAFDKDKSGTVNTDELRVMCVKLKIELSDAELDRMMKEADPDGSGEIDFGEFVAAVSVQLKEGGALAVLYKKALAVVAEAEGEGATWVTSLNPIIAAAALAKAKKPMRRAFIGAPTNASYSIAAEMGTPEDATCYEHSRDQTLGYFVRMNKLFMALALVSAICVVGFGGLIVISMFSTLFGLHFWGMTDVESKCASYEHTCTLYVEAHPGANCSMLWYGPADHKFVDRMGDSESSAEGMHGSCTVGQQWFNTCIKVFTIVFSYINLLPVPWRIAILMDALAPNHRSTVTDEAVEVEADPNEVGVEFYGRPTEALWFHLPRHLRRNVAICLNIGWVAHYASLGAHIYYWKYWDTQTWPGALAVNLPFVTSILFPIIGGIIQGKAENKVMEANPKRFPPSVGKYVRSAWAKYQEELRQGRPSGPGQACGVCCALFVCNKDFVKHLRAELQEMRKEQAEYEEMCGFEQKNMAGIIRQTDAESSTRKTTRSSTQGKTPPSSRTPASVEALPVKVTGVEADTVDAEQV